MTCYIRLMLAACLLTLATGCADTDNADPSEAEAFLRSHPEHPAAWRGVAAQRLSEQDYQGAAEAFEKLIEFEPDQPFHYAYLAVMLAHIGQIDETKARMQQAVAVAERVDDPERSELTAWKTAWEAANYAPDAAFELPLPKLAPEAR